LIQKNVVFGDTDNVCHIVFLAPLKHPVPAKTTVGAKDDIYVGPHLPEAFDQQC
jgi:hypothetical protein